MSRTLYKTAFMNALMATGYVGLVALFMTNVERLLPDVPTPLGATLFLLLFSISAAVMAIIVFGKPTLWYLDGRRSEAIRLLLATVGIMAVLGVSVFVLLLLVNSI